jgi:hypothetical protein
VEQLSYIFELDGETTWSPALRTGRAYVTLANSLADIFEINSGLAAIADDMYDIDKTQFQNFTKHTLDEYISATNLIYRSYIQGVLLTSLALLSNIKVEINEFIGVNEDLISLVQEYSKLMPA